MQLPPLFSDTVQLLPNNTNALILFVKCAGNPGDVFSRLIFVLSRGNPQQLPELFQEASDDGQENDLGKFAGADFKDGEKIHFNLMKFSYPSQILIFIFILVFPNICIQ